MDKLTSNLLEDTIQQVNKISQWGNIQQHERKYLEEVIEKLKEAQQLRVRLPDEPPD